MPEILKSNLEANDAVRLLYNIGALLDVPSAFFVKGKNGEYIMLGGLGNLTGMTGIPNSFKSTILHYMMLSAAARIYSTTKQCVLDTYDTEFSIHEARLAELAAQFEEFKGIDVFFEGLWTITDKAKYPGNEWFEKKKEFLKSKRENRAKLLYETPFLNRDRVSKMMAILPTFGEIDSLSEFETEDSTKMLDENEIGESGANTIYMRQSLARNRLMMELPGLGAAVNHCTLISAHIGKEIQMAAGPYAPPPSKKMQHMKPGEKIKGVSDKFYYLTNNFWNTTTATKLINQGTKGPEYPRDKDDTDAGDCDLNEINLMLLRGKTGPSGYVLKIIVSQSTGVLPSLTEFNYIKDQDRYGIVGTLQHYALEIYPDCKLSRTTVRNKIDNDVKLRRALNITSEMCQIRTYHREFVVPDAKTVYEGVKANGFDWDFILEHTRGWWTLNNDSHPTLHFLCSLDIIRMSFPKDHPDHYHPYWLEDDCKTVKKQFVKK